ncbi:hypothetical protein BH11PAT1_BH11PAT1_6540 [soil metagenome]
MANAIPIPPPDKITRRRRIIRSFEAKALSHRSVADKFSDFVTDFSGSITFLLLHVVWFAFWISINQGVIPGMKPFDPFPFGLLTMVVSLEAIVLSVFVLLSQNRDAHISKLRDELQLQVNLISEEEITKILELLHEMREKMGIKREDKELEKMLERIDTSYIERSLQKQMDNTGSTIDLLNIINNFPSHDKEILSSK